MTRDNKLLFAVDHSFGGCANSVQQFVSCDHALLKLATFTLHLLTNTSKIDDLIERITLAKVYADDYFDDEWSTDLLRGVYDFFPMPLSVQNSRDVDKFRYVFVTDPVYYSMYTSAEWSSDEDTLPVWFSVLVAPFHFYTWLAFTAAWAFFAGIYIMHSGYNSEFKIRKTAMPSACSTRIVFVIWIVFHFIMVVYDSNLKAILTVTQEVLPFRNLIHLAEQVEAGKKVVVVERNGSLRHALLTDEETSKEWPEFDSLRRIITNKPHSLEIELNVSKICESMRERPELVYLGYEELIRDQCPKACLWSYKVVEYPVLFQAWQFPKNSVYTTDIELFASAATGYYRQLLNRKRRTECEPLSYRAKKIDWRTVSCAAMLLAVCWTFGVIILCVEIGVACKMQRRTWELA